MKHERDLDDVDLEALAAIAPARTALELAAWLGHAPALAVTGGAPTPAATPVTPAALVAQLVALCDWDVEALSRAALALGGAALDHTEQAQALGGRLAAARAFVDCPCQPHARALLEAAGVRPAGPPASGRDAVDQACFLAFRAHDARYTSELEALAGLLVTSSVALGLAPAALDEAVRRELVPWSIGRARRLAALAAELGMLDEAGAP